MIMTKREAFELEATCDMLMSQYLNCECFVSMALTGRFKVTFDSGYITLEKDNKSPSYVNYHGSYLSLGEYIDSIARCIEENKELFEKLVWSYEHQKELIDE